MPQELLPQERFDTIQQAVDAYQSIGYEIMQDVDLGAVLGMIESGELSSSSSVIWITQELISTEVKLHPIFPGVAVELISASQRLIGSHFEEGVILSKPI